MIIICVGERIDFIQTSDIIGSILLDRTISKMLSLSRYQYLNVSPRNKIVG